MPVGSGFGRMPRRSRDVICVAICAWLWCVGCDGSHARLASPRPSPATGTVRTLHSGRKIRIMEVIPPERQGPPRTLSLFYRSDVRIKDQRALQREVVEVWDDFFRPQAEEVNAERAIIHVQEADNELGMGFVLRRNKDGTWRRTSGFLLKDDESAK